MAAAGPHQADSMTIMRTVGRRVGWLLAGYLVLRAGLELALIDPGSTHDYKDDWGGPTLAGVLAAQVLPGVLVLGFGVLRWAGRRVEANAGRSGR